MGLSEDRKVSGSAEDRFYIYFIQKSLGSDRIVLYRLYSFSSIIYFIISFILNVNIFIKVFATSLFISLSLRLFNMVTAQINVLL